MRKYRHTIGFILLFAVFILFLKYKGNNFKQSVLKNKYDTIGLVYDINYGTKRSVSIVYKYNFKNKEFKNTKLITNSNPNKYLNKNYRVICDSMNPQNSIIYLEEGITTNN